MITERPSPSTHPTLLIAVSKLDNEQAWQRFLNGYQPFILSRCIQLGLNSHDAEEVFQSVLLALVRTMPKFRYNPAMQFRGYLATVVVNAARTFWERNRRCPGGTGFGEMGNSHNIEKIIDSDSLSEFAENLDHQLSEDLIVLNVIMERVKARVEPHTWIAYWETAMNGVKPSIVAEQLKVTAATVYMAKKRVGEMIREEASALVSVRTND